MLTRRTATTPTTQETVMSQDAKASRPYTVASIDEIPTLPYEESPQTEWKPVRRFFGIGSFGSNLFRATRAGDVLTYEHSETEGAGTRHEELFLVVSGHAEFTVDGEKVDAPASTFVHVPDPDTVRGAVALEAGTVLLAVGAEPGAVFAPSDWDTEPLPQS
jgi:mannose-6-phosphate isomerase-like protein (cupin superfamily)